MYLKTRSAVIGWLSAAAETSDQLKASIQVGWALGNGSVGRSVNRTESRGISNNGIVASDF